MAIRRPFFYLVVVQNERYLQLERVVLELRVHVIDPRGRFGVLRHAYGHVAMQLQSMGHWEVVAQCVGRGRRLT